MHNIRMEAAFGSSFTGSFPPSAKLDRHDRLRRPLIGKTSGSEHGQSDLALAKAALRLLKPALFSN